MQTKTATNSARNFSHDKDLVNETTLAFLWAILTFIALMLFGFSI